MSFITKIQLGSIGYLDIDENISIPLNFSVAEIQDISKRQGGYSKTIKLPGTKNNNILLGQLFNVNIYDASFNQNLKSECTVLQNGVPVFNGYLQLLNVVKNSPTSLNPDQIKSYEVAVKDNTGDFYTSLQEKTLQDIDFSFYDHQYTLSSITATSAYTSDDVYTYFLPNRQSGVYILTDFTPSIYAKAYWDRIFFYAGYSYTWTGLTETAFNKLIIPYNGDVPKVDLSGNTFRAGISASTVSTVNLGVGINYLNPIFNNDSTGTNFDSANNYDPVTGIYTSNFIGQDQFTKSFTYKITLSASSAMTQTGLGAIRLDLIHTGYKDSQYIPITEPLFYSDAYTSLSLSAGTNIITSGITTSSFSTQVFNGTQIEHRVEANYWANAVTWLDLSGNTIPQANWPILQVEFGYDAINDVNNYYYNTPESSLNEGMIVQMNQFIPSQIKQKDFIASIIKMFNLYITVDPDNETNLIIQTRDEFYDSGKILDWTKKIDMLSEQKLQFLPDVSNKRLLFTYKEDKDFYNSNYRQETGEIFGQQQFFFENEFVQDVKKIEPIFSPTPLVKNTFNNIVPAITPKEPKNNIRILYYDGWIDGNWTLAGTGGTYTNISGYFSSFTKYPYAGHFDNPYTPSIDIDYGTNDYEFYNDWTFITNNNLYNKYYKRQVSQIETGKLLTAKFNLNEYDINNIDFRDKIFIHDSYWFINKIVDYNANIDGSLTTVELINVDEGITFSPQKIQVENVGGLFNYLNNNVSLGTVNIDNNIGIGVSGTDILGGQDNNLTDGTVRMRIAGNSNDAAVINGEVVGDLNAISGSDLFVHGYGNTIAGPANNVSIQGDLNSLSVSSENINIFGSGNTLGIYDTNIGIYNSNDNVIQDFVSGLTLINSFAITAATGVQNVTVINSNNLYISGSNLTYIDNTISGGGTSVFELGSAGAYSIKAINDTFIDATQNYAYAEGVDTLASGIASHAEGFGTTASANSSHAEGQQTIASGNYSHAEGFSSQSTGSTSHAEGSLTIAGGIASHAEGQTTRAIGNFSHAEGDDTLSSGIASHAEGRNTEANGLNSHAEGLSTRANGSYSHAEGNGSRSSGLASHAEGSGSISSGLNSHAEGSGSESSGDNSHCGGVLGIANKYGEWARTSNGNYGQYGFASAFNDVLSINTNVELTLNSSGAIFDIAVGETYMCEIDIIGKTSTGSAVFKYIDIFITNNAGTTQFLGTSSPVLASQYSDITVLTTPSITADNTNDKLKIEVDPLGSPLQDTKWFANIKYTKIV